jgi:hypothetical protein
VREILAMRSLDAWYALEPVRFPFPSLAACAARAPLGGAREAALATLMTARLALAAVPGPDQLAAAVRVERATAARQWLASVALAPAPRSALARALDATGQDDRAALAEALVGVATAVAPHLDAMASAEFRSLVTRVTA